MNTAVHRKANPAGDLMYRLRRRWENFFEVLTDIFQQLRFILTASNKVLEAGMNAPDDGPQLQGVGREQDG